MDDVTLDDLFAVIGRLYVRTLVLEKQVREVSKAAFDMQAREFFGAGENGPQPNGRPDDAHLSAMRGEVPPA